MKVFYTYILHCADDSFYTGITNNIERRLAEHNSGYHSESYTYSRRPLKLVHYEEFQNPNDAIAREKQIKKWSRKKKIALIEGDFDSIIKLSKKKFNKE